MPDALAEQRAGSGGGRAARERRADARRNIAAILDAALECLARDPQASIADIAQAAGVGRVTLYGHFASRAELVGAAFGHAIRQADEVLDTVDLSGDPRDALARLVEASWLIMERYRGALTAAERELPAEGIRTRAHGPMTRVAALISRGQREGAFRCDLPVDWLVTVFYSVMHGAAGDISAGRLRAEHAAAMITAILLGAFTPPVSAAPEPGAR